LLPGEGVIPLDDILVRLKQIGFDGLCSVELFRPEYWERDPEDLAAAARAATLETVENYFSLSSLARPDASGRASTSSRKIRLDFPRGLVWKGGDGSN
jgi:hypothetical protein